MSRVILELSMAMVLLFPVKSVVPVKGSSTTGEGNNS